MIVDGVTDSSGLDAHSDLLVWSVGVSGDRKKYRCMECWSQTLLWFLCRLCQQAASVCLGVLYLVESCGGVPEPKAFRANSMYTRNTNAVLCASLDVNKECNSSTTPAGNSAPRQMERADSVEVLEAADGAAEGEANGFRPHVRASWDSVTEEGKRHGCTLKVRWRRKTAMLQMWTSFKIRLWSKVYIHL